MSTTRDSIFYSDIQDLLKKKLSEHGYPVSRELLREILSDLFDSVALHVWSREDVVGIAKEHGYPISPDATDEILANIERHIDCELGITWQTVEIAVDDFYSGIDWWELPKEKRQSYQGDFVLQLADDAPPPEKWARAFVWQGKYGLLKDANMQEAFDIAGKIVRENDLVLTLYAVPSGTVPEQLQTKVEEKSIEICDFYPDDFEEEQENE